MISIEMINLLTGLPEKNETSETIVLNIHCLLLYVIPCNRKLMFFLSKSLNQPSRLYLGRKLILTNKSSKLRSSLQSHSLQVTLYLKILFLKFYDFFPIFNFYLFLMTFIENASLNNIYDLQSLLIRRMPFKPRKTVSPPLATTPSFCLHAPHFSLQEKNV